MSNLLSVEKLTMKFGGLVAIDDLSFDASKLKSSIATRPPNFIVNFSTDNKLLTFCLHALE